ncbi:hypothetical protein FRC09_015749, partial [Ceratobasidium sp. 395]
PIRAFKSTLRGAIYRKERPPTELKWSLAPLEHIQGSGPTPAVATARSRISLNHLQTDWAKAMVADRELEERVTRAKSESRDI